jgi:hypothetical protein
MTRPRLVLLLILAPFLAAPFATAAAGDAAQQFPLARSQLTLRDAGKTALRRVAFKARWKASGAVIDDPTFAGATLRIAGGGPDDGDTGVIRLPGSKWSRSGRDGRTFQYEDAARAHGGIEAIVVRQGRKTGVLKVTGGSATWPYAIEGPQARVSLTFTIGAARWCTDFRPPFVKNAGRRVVARRNGAPASCPCDEYPSTFAAIQQVIFERRGCTSSVCHGSAAQGGLDLSAGSAYANLVDVPSALGQMKRVEPGDPERSFLWRKLAKATRGLDDVPGTAMPNGLPPLPDAELEALEKWIHAGAPIDGVVPGTEVILGSCLPPPDPIKIRPPDPPAPSEGVQFYGPPWEIPAEGENEVCYARYYDLSAQIPTGSQAPCPEEWGGPTQQCFFYNRSELTQDPNSHHSIIHYYRGTYAVTDPAAKFGPFTCKGGETDGTPCDPLGVGLPAPGGADCGARSACAGQVVRALACVGYGPPDFGLDLTGAGSATSPTLVISTETLLQTSYPGGVYSVLPVKGVLVFNSHAFNTTSKPTTNEQWFNLYFAPPADRAYLLHSIFDSADIFVENVPPFETREYCRTYTVPQHGRLFQLSSHTHKRGKLFRIWGPGIAADCRSSAGECLPETGPSIFTTTDYSDPTVLTYDPPPAFDDPDPTTRRFKFCARYDNGAENPAEVKRRSTAPIPPLPLGGPCRTDEVACLAGPRKGELCGGDDRACDSAPGALDGVCDACPVKGGVTTEDEMFIMLGGYYQVP